MNKIRIILAGLPGKMASLVARRIAKDKRYHLDITGFTGAEYNKNTFQITTEDQELHFNLLRPDERTRSLPDTRDFIVVDFTQPNAANDNCKFYCENNIPFVMGTTGGNRELLVETVQNSNTTAVIAPNMSMPIVMLMNMIEDAANIYAGILEDWEIRIVESHQSSKKDVSGTAIAIGKKLQNLGVKYTGEENIRTIRDAVTQLFRGIPRNALGGHGWHEYSLISPDGNVQLGFKHNINGRETYVDGTLKAVDFLAKQVNLGVTGVCYDMTDVMRG